MAIDKNSTGYTFLFSIAMVVVVGTALAFTALSLKDRQDANAANYFSIRPEWGGKDVFSRKICTCSLIDFPSSPVQ